MKHTLNGFQADSGHGTRPTGNRHIPTARPRASKWDRPRVVEALTTLHRQKQPLASRSLRRTHPALASAAVHHFGTYRDAVIAAGIDYAQVRSLNPHRWDQGAVLRELRRLHDAGKLLHEFAMERENAALVGAAYRQFGNYRKAVEAAALDFESIRVREQQVWDRRRVIDELSRLHGERRVLHDRAMRRARNDLYAAAKYNFGSYSRAAQAAGIDAAALQPPAFRVWSPERVIRELGEIRRSEISLAPKDLRKARPSFYTVCCKRFGSYRKALEAAGIAYEVAVPARAIPMSADQVIQGLRSLVERGQDIRYSAIRQTSRALLNSACHWFGSYRAAVEACGFEYPPKAPLRHWTEPLIIQTLQEMNDAGLDLRHASMKRYRRPLFEAAKYYFGSYIGAVRAARLDYDEIVARRISTVSSARCKVASVVPLARAVHQRSSRISAEENFRGRKRAADLVSA